MKWLMRCLAAETLRWVPWIRNRFRCPSCQSVGTYKPHGAIFDRWWHRDRPVYRWLCKWCGYYRGPERPDGARICVIDEKRRVWAFIKECPTGDTPQTRLRRTMKANPWHG